MMIVDISDHPDVIYDQGKISDILSNEISFYFSGKTFSIFKEPLIGFLKEIHECMFSLFIDKSYTIIPYSEDIYLKFDVRDNESILLSIDPIENMSGLFSKNDFTSSYYRILFKTYSKLRDLELDHSQIYDLMRVNIVSESEDYFIKISKNFI